MAAKAVLPCSHRMKCASSAVCGDFLKENSSLKWCLVELRQVLDLCLGKAYAEYIADRNSEFSFRYAQQQTVLPGGC